MTASDLRSAHLAPSPDPRDSFAFDVARRCGAAKAAGWNMTEAECIDEAVELLGSDDASAIDRAYRVGARVYRSLFT